MQGASRVVEGDPPLLSALADALGLLYNATGDVQCYDLDVVGPAAADTGGPRARCRRTMHNAADGVAVFPGNMCVRVYVLCLHRSLGLSSVHRAGGLRVQLASMSLLWQPEGCTSALVSLPRGQIRATAPLSLSPLVSN